MKPDVIILDSNIWISYILNGKISVLAKLIIVNQLYVVSCLQLSTEIEEVLKREKFRKYIRANEIVEAVAIHRKLCRFVELEQIAEVLNDPKDNYLIALYKVSAATVLVSGYKQLISQGKSMGFNVITLSAFNQLVRKASKG